MTTQYSHSDPSGRPADFDNLHPVDAAHPSDYYEIRRRRMLAFIVDYVIIALLSIPATIVVALAGVITFGAAWLLFGALVPLVALSYIAITMGGPRQATVGMGMFSIYLRRLDGGRVDWLLAILHSLLFWVVHVALTPFMLAASMFSSRKRLVQDWLLGTEVVRSD